MTRYTISLVNGDGIGPELAESAKILLDKIHDSSSIKFNIIEVEAGDNALKKFGKALPDFSFDSIKKSDACLKSPVGENAADVILVLRRFFRLFANIRPIKSYPNVSNIQNIDLVIVRENTEDLYRGWEFKIDDETIIGLRLTSAKASKRIALYAFDEAVRRNKKKHVTTVHKSNVLRLGDGLFTRIAREVSTKFPDITYSEQYVDACAMNLIRKPESFDIILTTNLFGDILSDEAAQIAGSLGLGPSANIGENFAIFEPVHGAAFDIANKNIANPASIFLSIKMMLEWLAKENCNNDEETLKSLGKRIDQTLISLLRDKSGTKDVGGDLETDKYTKLFVSKFLTSNLS
jgi:3-isopropylmalate dehydrogenase